MEQKELKQKYEEYKTRIETRIAAGETTLTVKPYKDWIRKGKDKDKNTINVPGESGETRTERGTRVAARRLSEFISVKEKLTNLRNPEYAFTEAQVDKAIATVKTGCEEIIAVFEAKRHAPSATTPEKIKKPVFEF